MADSLKNVVSNNFSTADSLKIVLENLRFISGSYKEMLATRGNQEWTILIALISLCFFLVYGSLRFQVNLKKRIVWIFFVVFAGLSIGLSWSIQLAHDKNQKTYLWADHSICQIINRYHFVDTTDNGVSITDSGKCSPAWWGRWIIMFIQWLFIITCASLSGLLILNRSKLNNHAGASTISTTGLSNKTHPPDNNEDTEPVEGSIP